MRVLVGQFAVPGIERVIEPRDEAIAELNRGLNEVRSGNSGGTPESATMVTRLEQLERAQEQLNARLDALLPQVNANLNVAADNAVRRSRSELEIIRKQLTREVDMTRTRVAVPDDVATALELYRETASYRAVLEKAHPMVSVTVATYNRSGLLVDRCLRSILDQTYEWLEILVVGDGCTDDTEERVAALGDPRIRFVNLAERSVPAHVSSGSEASNLALTMVSGDFITHLDDDDEYLPDRIARLVEFIQDKQLELAWHPFWWQEQTAAEWALNEALEFEFAKVTGGSVMYMAWFGRIAWDALASRYDAPADWTLYRSLRDLGARAGRYPEPLLRHYREGLNPRRAEAMKSD